MNRLFLLFCFIFFLVPSVYSQQDYKGVVLDANSKEPLPYVNIGIVDKGIGTVSDEEGKFHLNLNRELLGDDDRILFSSLGYQTLYIPFTKAVFVYNEYPEIYLKPSDIELNEVVVTDKQLVPVTEFVGYRNTGEMSFGYWKDNMALGGELATKISVKKALRKLNELEFEVAENPSDSLLIRVNIYDTDGFVGAPGTNLNTSNMNILHTLTKGRQVARIDMEANEIYVNDDFFVSLELVKQYGDQPLGLVLKAASDKEGSYRKYASQDKWKRISDVNMAYYVKSTPYVSQSRAQKYVTKAEKVLIERNMVSGFAIHNGIMLSGITVYNNRTKASVITDSKGRYSIQANKYDILIFSGPRYKRAFIEIDDQKFANALMKLEDSSP